MWDSSKNVESEMLHVLLSVAVLELNCNHLHALDVGAMTKTSASQKATRSSPRRWHVDALYTRSQTDKQFVDFVKRFATASEFKELNQKLGRILMVTVFRELIRCGQAGPIDTLALQVGPSMFDENKNNEIRLCKYYMSWGLRAENENVTDTSSDKRVEKALEQNQNELSCPLDKLVFTSWLGNLK